MRHSAEVRNKPLYERFAASAGGVGSIRGRGVLMS
jgi:hypothetical protein